ncbi:hypothetical protein FAZ69_20785 [Trinickia terrae]|uniref:Uncharacterized protein n=1 Tax=Trinickia terrae TaxID=2571161 RepID=A0A4U1HXA4_9BURK|nr:hypothetical protein [Trinickia terrae]TKC86292.1 hypothetical protein FAZ69_20785 [Trinickia terrae]
MTGRDAGTRTTETAEPEHAPATGAAVRSAAPTATPAPARKRSNGPRRLGPLTRALVVGVWVWSLVEIPWEVRGSESMAQTLALLFSKALLTVLVICALRGVRGARVLFTFVCAVSVIAIGLDLPVEFNVLRMGFYLSIVDCAIKFAAALALVSRYANRNGGGA